MSETKLKACPFCGDTESLEVCHDPRTILHPAYRVICDNCGAKSGYSDRGDRVEKWNTRTSDADEIIAMLEDEVAKHESRYALTKGTSFNCEREAVLEVWEDALEQAREIKAKHEVSDA